MKPKPKPKPQLVKKPPVRERSIPVTDQHTQHQASSTPEHQAHQAQKKEEEQKKEGEQKDAAPAIDPKLPPNVKVHLPVPPPVDESAPQEKTAEHAKK